MNAACASHPSPDWWFSDVTAERNAAQAICDDCPIRQKCGDEARARDELFGIWGWYVVSAVFLAVDGFMLGEMPEPAAVEVEHGRRGTGCTCLRCKAAHARYVAEWRRRDVTPAAGSTAEQLDLWETA